MIPPLVFCILNDAVFSAEAKRSAIALSVRHLRLTALLPHRAPRLAVHQGEVAAVLWPQIWSNERDVADKYDKPLVRSDAQLVDNVSEGESSVFAVICSPNIIVVSLVVFSICQAVLNPVVSGVAVTMSDLRLAVVG